MLLLLHLHKITFFNYLSKASKLVLWERGLNFTWNVLLFILIQIILSEHKNICFTEVFKWIAKIIRVKYLWAKVPSALLFSPQQAYSEVSKPKDEIKISLVSQLKYNTENLRDLFISSPSHPDKIFDSALCLKCWGWNQKSPPSVWSHPPSVLIC